MRTWMLTAIGVTLLSVNVLADDGHGNGNNNNNNQNNNSSFQGGVVGSTPGTTIGGVVSGGAPWVVSQSEASVSADGRVRVEVTGLLIGPGGPTNLVGTTGPVTMVGASLVCGGSGGAPVPEFNGFVTPSPLSTSGRAEINQLVTMPAVCVAPVVLVRFFNSAAPPGSQLGPFIAESGIAAGAGQNQNQNQNQNENQNDDDHGGDH
jgi:hypothetical protein